MGKDMKRFVMENTMQNMCLFNLKNSLPFYLKEQTYSMNDKENYSAQLIYVRSYQHKSKPKNEALK